MSGNANLSPVHAFVDELWRAGVRSVCVSPGSRSTPLTLSFATHGGFRLFTILDERGSGYFALGLARRSGAPVALVCTSGTAAANYHPAIMEALQSTVPLIVLTADRPPELHDVGSNQTVRQSGMFGSHVRFSVDMPVPNGSATANQHAAATAWRVVGHAMTAPRGPVHVNWPFREPLVPIPRSVEGSMDTVHRGGLRQLSHGPVTPDDELVSRLVQDLCNAKRPLIVCGPQESGEVAQQLLAFASAVDVPLLADPLSQIRTHIASDAHAGWIIDSYDWFVDARFNQIAAADCVIRFGRTPTSKGLNQYLGDLTGAVHWVVSDSDSWLDPGFTTTDVCIADAQALCTGLLQRIERLNREQWLQERDHQWTRRWTTVNERVGALVKDEALSLSGQSSGLETALEGRVWSELMAVVPEGCNLFVGNSMPVRDVDGFLRAQVRRRLRIFANRGVSGIDGVISSAAGTAAAANEPTLLVIGDVSFFHDSNGLFTAVQAQVPLVIVILHNDGGGIFRTLPQVRDRETFAYFETPHGLDFRGVAQAYGAHFVEPRTWVGVQEAVTEGFLRTGVTVVQIRTSAEWSTEVRRRLRVAVQALVEERWSL